MKLYFQEVSSSILRRLFIPSDAQELWRSSLELAEVCVHLILIQCLKILLHETRDALSLAGKITSVRIEYVTNLAVPEGE